MSMSNQFSPSDLSALFTKFHALYGYFGAGALKGDTAEAKILRDAYWSRLRGNTTAEVDAAAEAWISGSHDKWPNPGQLLAVIYSQRPERRMVVTDDSDPDYCGCKPGCRWQFYWVRDGVKRRTQDCVAYRLGYPRVEDV